MTYSDAIKLPYSEAYIMYIVLGNIHGGEYDYKRRRWAKQPSIMA